jgi:pyruvate,water dikinase
MTVNNYDSQLYERAKELECLYQVDEVLQNKGLTLPDAMKKLVELIPLGFTQPPACRAQISLWNETYSSEDFSQAQVLYRSPLKIADEQIGEVAVGCICELVDGDCSLLINEIKLLDTIAQRISQMTLEKQRELLVMLDMLSNIDPDMLLRIGEKMRIYLKKKVGAEADHLFDDINLELKGSYGELNTPMAKPSLTDAADLRTKLVAAAAAFLPQGDMYELISRWIKEQRVLALVKTIDNKDTSIRNILDALRRYTKEVKSSNPPSTIETWLIAELAHRFLSTDEDTINLVLDNLKIADFESILERIIGSSTSRGNIGGKGAGLFIAKQILRQAAEAYPELRDIRTPLTWYLATDKMVDFLHYNNLEELNSYKYNSLFDIRNTYDNVVSRIKNASLPPHTVQMLHVVLEEMGDVPLIVRSSSLLEDQRGDAFSGKYKSLFLPNKGTRNQRLEALKDAILEVYSSMYNPDAIQYRLERGLLNSIEQMGILIQEVIGCRVGKYYLPAFSGVAFSHNLLRWSPRIRREDGLLRLVMGLGTRAVDRVKDDYPILVSLGQPELTINQTPDDIRHYSPKYIDLINLEENRFETIEVSRFLREAGDQLPDLHKYVSVYNEGFIENKNSYSLDIKKDELVVTFQHILTSSDIPKKIKLMLDVLSKKMDNPVDIEFAYDGSEIYLLQCRPQGSGLNSIPAPIPQNLQHQDIVFTANRYISNGLVNGITHVVFVDGEGYRALSSLKELYSVGEAVGQLNQILPRRKFILIGPGRWGSRGDVRLGVRVTFSDISGTAALIEVAGAKNSYSPELSFGTHFFQDLVESGIFYIPLYPGSHGTVWKEGFFKSNHNLLGRILPDFAWLSDVIRVIDVPASCFGQTLSIHMNSDQEKAVAFLTKPEPAAYSHPEGSDIQRFFQKTQEDQGHWQWRHYMAQQIADTMDMKGFGVKGVYLIGSVNTGDAGMGSDIDLLLHINELSQEQKCTLEGWLDGWSRALAKINYLQTGHVMNKMLDVHMVTDQDIREGSSFAVKINSLLDPAAPLRILSGKTGLTDNL